MPAPYEAVYGASKAFVYSFAEALRNELKDTGVTVTALMSGPTETNFFHRAGMDDTKVGESQKDDPAEVARQGFEALMAGKRPYHRRFLRNESTSYRHRLLAGTCKAELHRSMAEPESAKTQLTGFPLRNTTGFCDNAGAFLPLCSIVSRVRASETLRRIQLAIEAATAKAHRRNDNAEN